jgi:hypothetical protein
VHLLVTGGYGYPEHRNYRRPDGCGAGHSFGYGSGNGNGYSDVMPTGGGYGHGYKYCKPGTHRTAAANYGGNGIGGPIGPDGRFTRICASDVCLDPTDFRVAATLALARSLCIY